MNEKIINQSKEKIYLFNDEIFREKRKNGRTLFKSFWMAGYECSDQLNAFGERVNLLKETGHDIFIEDDYAALIPFEIKTIREGVQWSEAEKSPFVYDWTWMDKAVMTARKYDHQIIWDLCHFGFPSDITPLHPKFPERFSAFAEAFARHFKEISPEDTLMVVPINEVSFLSWLGGDVRGTAPYTFDNGWHVKYAMMNAYIQAIQKIKAVNEKALIISTEPLINITCGVEDEDLKERARCETENQFQVLDILTGRMCPELGGKEDYPDVIGLNYYFPNQWQLPQKECLDWRDTSCCHYISPYKLIKDAYLRYKKPIIISETSHMDDQRSDWIEMMAEQCKKAIDEGVPVLGICLYPIISRPDWDHLSNWHNCGLWDVFTEKTGLERILHPSYKDALIRAMDHVQGYGIAEAKYHKYNRK